MTRIVINSYIVADPSICHGKPTFKGTRIMVWQILDMLAVGETIAEIHRGFPSITAKHVKAALEYASSITRDHTVVVNTEPALPA